MAQVCDFEDQSIDLDAVKANGFEGIISYASDDIPKNLTLSNKNKALSLGLSVNIVCEQANQPALRGAPGGTHDAQISNQQADVLGYDGWLFYVAEDPSQLSSASWPTVEAYFEAVVAEGGRPEGGYGGWQTLNQLHQLGLIQKGWMVQTWNQGAPNPLPDWIVLMQLVGANTFGLPIDADEVLQSDYGQMPRPIPAPTGGTKMISDIFGFKAGQIDQMQCSFNTLWHKYSEDGGQTWRSEPVASPTGAPFAFSIPTQEPKIDVSNGVLTVSVEDASTNLHHFKQAASGPVNGNWWNHVAVP